MSDNIKPDSNEQANDQKPERVPALTFPYPLDTFQQESIDHLENGDSVLVSAHTSAGKTTVALYAIAMHLKAKRRVIYTSPIKALSNQKFREFSDKFESVGLMTGDTTVKPSADCLVMTTEILRSMLYRGTEMLREVGCVVFDEVHYMRDKNRGVVWEETIVMLPERCQYVFLSATIPNGQQFAEWVMHIHPGTKVHGIHTDKRPVPLRHYVYAQGGNGLFQIVEENRFNEDNYNKALQAFAAGSDEMTDNNNLAEAGKKRGRASETRRGTVDQTSVMQVMSHIILNNMHPCIVFVFAKSECERLALTLSKSNFNTEEEEKFVTETYQNAMESLSEDDRKLPAVQQLLPLLQRGVGIHHSGLLPMLKEVVELLFSAGLVKCLFSTETFSMGLNMPARTVVFTNVKKFDGQERRFLTSGEYIQMSGRAGRRGLDRHGVAVIMLDEPVDTSVLRAMTSGAADVLNSSFHLTYNMVLNLLRVEDADPKYMMMRSFYQFQHEGTRPVLEQKVADLQQKLDGIQVDNQPVCQQYWTCLQQLDKLFKERHAEMVHPRFLTPYLQCGRLLRVIRKASNEDYGFGICVQYFPKAPDLDAELTSTYEVEVLIATCADVAGPFPLPARDGGEVDFRVVKFDMVDIDYISRLRVAVPEDRRFPAEERVKQHKSLRKLLTRHPNGLPALDPVTEMKIPGEKFAKTCKRIEKLQELLHKNPLSAGDAAPEDLRRAYAMFQTKKELEDEMLVLNAELEKLKHVVLNDELDKMMRVLRRLDYVSEDNILLRKGRIACEITTSDQDELLLTELLFRGVFNDMETEMIVALLSCLVNVHKTPDSFNPDDKFHVPLRQLYDVNQRLHKVAMDAGLIADTASESGAEKIMPSLIDLTYKWAKGCKFVEIVGTTDAYEGDIVRMMRRLEELLRQLASAARSPAVGSMALSERFLDGITKIKRDIVFASSLYL
eukprot:PhM_4_TR458/c0_g1_i1/m.31146/K12598/MTR4, SKIV2L2; ATP-dependent RNA helicase DOB1